MSLRWGCDAKTKAFTLHLFNIWLIFALIEDVQRCCTLCVTALLMINGSALRLSVLFTKPHNRRFMWRWLILHYSDFSLSTGGSPVRIYRSGERETLPVIYTQYVCFTSMFTLPDTFWRQFTRAQLIEEKCSVIKRRGKNVNKYGGQGRHHHKPSQLDQ